MRIIYLSPEELLTQELDQAREEGKSVADVRAEWEQVRGAHAEAPQVLRREADRLLGIIESRAIPPENAAREPSDLDTIRAARPEAGRAEFTREVPADDELLDRILGGWLGRAAGCLLGKPVEKAKREGVRALLESAGKWPLTAYFSAEGIAPDVIQRYPWNRYGGVESLTENLVCMPEDDDLNYTMLALHLAETHAAGEGGGSDLTADDVLQAWLEMLPVLATFTAERVAYLNALKLLTPPETATHRNPYREWIGAQIRTDLWGWICPGDPERAATLAFRDASVSHVKNGIYGALFVAGATAAASAGCTPVEAVEAGLAQVPEHSRLAEAVRFGLELPSRAETWEEAVDLLYERYGSYHWVHAVNNAAVVAAAVAWADGDFATAICTTVMAGWDTDSNGATVGAIMGTCLGANRLPTEWTEPLGGRIRTSLKGFDHSAFDDLARRTYCVAQRRASTD